MSFVSLGTRSRLQTISLVLSFLSKRRPKVSSSLSSSHSTHSPCQGAYGDGGVMNANASSGFSLALNDCVCDLADSDVSASSAALWSSSSDKERRNAGKNKTKTVTGRDVWCREHVR